MAMLTPSGVRTYRLVCSMRVIRPVKAEAAQVVGHLAGGVGAWSSPVIKARRLLLVMPVTARRVAQRAPARAVIRGSPKRSAGVLRPSASADGCAIRSKAGLART